jgi:hypothetical protein
MKDTDLFQLAMGLVPPWQVMQCAFDKAQGRLYISIGFVRGGTFVCPECGRAGCKAYDTEERTWRHLNFFQYETYGSSLFRVGDLSGFHGRFRAAAALT